MPCGCPSGYSFNPSTGLCEQITNESYVGGTDFKTAQTICPQDENMINGTAVYPTINPSQFPLTGQNTVSPSFLDAQSNTVVPAATILAGSLWIGGNPLSGLLNQRGIGLPSTLNTWYGVSRCVTVAAGSTISFALSAKEAFRLYIDGVLAIIHQPSLPAKANQNLHVFPINLTPGQHTFRAEALSTNSSICSGTTAYGCFLVEVYNNVNAAILSGITSQATLNGYYASTNGSIPAIIPGSIFDVSSNPAFGLFYCPNGYLNACTTGAFSCTVVNTLPYIPCCFTLTECTTGATIITNSDISGYINHVVKIQEATGCYIVSFNNDINCTGSIGTVTITDTFEDCITCTQVFYRLTDCNGVATDIITTTDFSADVGLVVKIEGFDDVCWIVTITSQIPSPITVVRSNGFLTCEACLYVPPTPIPSPPFYLLSPVDLKTRSVQPGYDTEHCSPDFVEKVNCSFAQQVYAKLIEQKYGVQSCLVDDYDKYYIKKRLLELNLINDPNYCKPKTCLAPCGISIQIQEFNPITNTAPIDLSAGLIFTPTNLPPPTDIDAGIDYQSNPTF